MAEINDANRWRQEYESVMHLDTYRRISAQSITDQWPEPNSGTYVLLKRVIW